MVRSPNPDWLPMPEPQDFFPPLNRWARWSGLGIVAAVGIAVGLSTVTQYRVTVRGQAVVRPTGELRLVQAATEGTVKQILVTENQTIQQGDAIATLDDSRLQTEKQQRQSSLAQAQQQLLQISAQIRAIDHQILAETDRRDRAMASAQAELQRNQRDYQAQQKTTTAAVAESTANLHSAEAALESARLRVARYRPVAEAGALSRDQLEEAELVVAQQLQAVQMAEAQLQQAQAALNPSPAEITIAAERIAQERASGTAAIAALNREREALIQQRIQIQTQLEQDQQELQQLERDLSRTTLTAPTDGAIAQLYLRNPGQAVRPGEEVAQIAPSQAQLVVKSWVAVQDIGKVAVGQPAQIRISACPYPDYGTLKGTVSAISPDAMGGPRDRPTAATASPETTGSATFYEVTIQPETLTLSQSHRQCQIQLGMAGQADIISREETVLQFLRRKARLTTQW